MASMETAEISAQPGAEGAEGEGEKQQDSSRSTTPTEENVVEKEGHLSEAEAALQPPLAGAVAAALPMLEALRPDTRVSSKSSLNSDQQEDDNINTITLRLWLTAVNNLISKSSVQIMTLGFLGDRRKLPFGRLTEAKQASDIFDLLYEYYGSNQEAVRRFVYALARLGHQRKGFKCIRQYKEKVGQKLPPKFESRNESDPERFGLCQCLVEICVIIEKDSDVAEALRKYCGHYLLEMASDNIKSVGSLLVLMYHRQLITPGDQDSLAAALKVVNAKDCIECIRKYRIKYGHPELKINDQKYRDLYREAKRQQQQQDTESIVSFSTRTSRTTTISSTQESNRPDSASSLGTISEEYLQDEDTAALLQSQYATDVMGLQNPPPALLQSQYTTDVMGLQHPPETSQQHVVLPANGRDVTSDPRLRENPEEDGNEQQPLLPRNEEPVPPDPSAVHPTLTPAMICKIVLIILFSLTLLGGGITLIAVGALTDIPKSTDTDAYGNTSAVIATFSTLNVDEISLSEDSDPISLQKYVDFKTDYYLTDSCLNLPSINTSFTNSSILSLPSKTIRYFLKGSVLSYNICSAANVTGDYIFDFFILKNLRDSAQNPPPPYKDPVRYSLLKVGFSENVTNEHEPGPGWKCHYESNDYNLHYSVKRDGYYPVIILPPKSPPQNALIKYWYQVNIAQRHIDTTSRRLSLCQPNADSTTCRPISHLPLAKYCIVAHVKANSVLKFKQDEAEDLYVNIRIEYHKWAPGLPLFIASGILSVVLSLVPCICLYRRPLKKKVRQLPSDLLQSLHVSTEV